MIFQRTEQLIGSEGLERLRLSKVAIFGIGGVGSYVFEGLVRSGIGRFLLVDKDVVDKTNINRQLVAYHSTVGQPKVEVAKNRGIDINPDVKIDARQMFYLPETKTEVNLEDVDYIIDAMDNVTAKLMLIEEAKRFQNPLSSALARGINLTIHSLRLQISARHPCVRWQR